MPEQVSPLLVIFGVLIVLVQLVIIPLLLRRFQKICLAILGGLTTAFAFFLVALFPVTGTLPLNL